MSKTTRYHNISGVIYVTLFVCDVCSVEQYMYITGYVCMRVEPAIHLFYYGHSASQKEKTKTNKKLQLFFRLAICGVLCH